MNDQVVTVSHVGNEIRRYCDSPRKKGRGPCKNPAGWGTNHVGQGRCRKHGGNMPIKHGRYSTIVRPRLVAIMAELDKDPNPLDILPEVQFVRAALIDWTERYDKYTEALIAWHESFKAPRLDAEGNATGESYAKPMQVLDVADGYRMASEATKMVERIWKFQEARSVPFGLFGEFLNLFVTAVKARCTPEQQEGIDTDYQHALAQLAAKLDMRVGVR